MGGVPSHGALLALLPKIEHQLNREIPEIRERF